MALWIHRGTPGVIEPRPRGDGSRLASCHRDDRLQLTAHGQGAGQKSRLCGQRIVFGRFQGGLAMQPSLSPYLWASVSLCCLAHRSTSTFFTRERDWRSSTTRVVRLADTPAALARSLILSSAIGRFREVHECAVFTGGQTGTADQVRVQIPGEGLDNAHERSPQGFLRGGKRFGPVHGFGLICSMSICGTGRTWQDRRSARIAPR